MKYMGLNELRESYLRFFESKGHLRMNSFPLIPKNDNSLLLINAGMAPLKPYFTGQEVPPRKRGYDLSEMHSYRRYRKCGKDSASWHLF